MVYLQARQLLLGALCLRPQQRLTLRQSSLLYKREGGGSDAG